MKCIYVEITTVGILLLLNSLYGEEFPASEFFGSINVTMDGSSQVESYLCQEGEKTQCCSCSEDCYTDCCINRYWNKSATYDLTTYLEIFKKIQKEKITKQNLQCKSIFSPLLKAETSEKILMQNCDLNEKNLSNSRIAYDFESGKVFPRNACVSNESANLSYPNIKAFCSHNVTNVSKGTVFTLELRQKYENCVFRAEGEYVRRCRHEKTDCDHRSPLHEMCHMYAAPVRNYKNPHCYFCRQKSREGIYLTGCRRFKDIVFLNPVEIELTSNNENELIIISIQLNFPLLDFFNKTTKEIQLDNPDRYVTCNVRESKGLHIGCCDCSPDCFKSKLCCVDALWSNLSKQTMKYYAQQLVDKSRHGKKHVCRSIKFKLEKNTIVEKKYYMLTSCPPESDYFELCTKEDDAKLEFDWTFVVPVLGADGYLYKNIYCAFCNLVYDFKPVNLTVHCHDNERLNNCTLYIHDEHDRRNLIKECYSDSPLIDSCDESHEYYELCNSYVGPVNGYRNYHCLMCHLNETKGFLKVQGDKCSLKRGSYSWFMLIRFKKNIKVDKIEDISMSNYCANKRFTDMRRITSFQEAADCWLERIVEYPSIDNCLYQYKLHLFIILPLKTSRIEAIFQNLKLRNHSFYVYHQGNEGITFKVNERFDSVQVKIILRQYQNTFTKWSYDARFIFTPNPTPLISDLHDLTFQNNFPYGQLCYRFITLDVEDVVFTPNCSAIHENDLIDYHNLFFWISMTKNKIKRNVISCTRYYMIPNCTLREQRIKTVFENGSIKDENGNLYPVEEYLPTRNGAAICGLPKRPSQVDNIEIWLTNALLPLSLVGYFIVIVTYISFKTLKNLPGLCTIALTSSLMIGDSMVLLNNIFNLSGLNKVYFLCKIVAILMHFFIIKAYFWTLMISYLIMNHFTKHIVFINNRDMKEKFNHLLLISLCVSFAIIGAAFLLDQLEIVLIGYGDNGTCVPHEFYGRVAFYMLPMFLFILVSFGFLLRTVTYLAIERRRLNKYLEQSFMKRISITLMFIKLALVLGINDIVGIVQLANQSTSGSSDNLFDDVFGMVYSVLRSLRGVFLFLVYVCKHEVICLYKQHFGVKVSGDVKELDTGETSLRGMQYSTNESNNSELRAQQSHFNKSNVRKSEIRELNVRELSVHESNVLEPVESRLKNCSTSDGGFE